ncbi:MAG: hypothetical protein AUG06_06085 [Actinobacteria bacterium 13_1_20CM_2_65_11]|nr:MAG: hypothetical protein AUH40_02620 [Chloroflexi bacterium 13_1_40CM_65_17]OLD23392.1 MAG: hypothetical protein AUJ02_11240 [Chloroflexi bacterium 13_1_40CM_3_65_12]OLD49946.1 MAG: hypothetical protein AUI42_05550 [Actinobacteria bacterium 13_1_40CM_2_65_8]OLE80095.1 MAG: hypothetical protein AUG06_06085 [Actinobacteria bacterium 13_1_20CM_2_65_11]
MPRPARTVRWPACAASIAISTPEVPAPTTSTSPVSCDGFRYSPADSCVIAGLMPAANAGTLGRW